MSLVSRLVTLAMSGPFISASAWRIEVSPSVGFSSRLVKSSRNRAFEDPSYVEVACGALAEAGRLGERLEELARRKGADRHRGEQVRRRQSPSDPTRAGQA